MRSWWSEPQSAPVLFLLTVYSFPIFGYKEYNQSEFGIGHWVMSRCKVGSYAVENGNLLWPVHSVDRIVNLCPDAFYTPKPNLPVIPGISWLPTFAFQFPMISRTSFLVLVLGLVGLCRTDQLLQHQWLGHSLGLLWCWMVFPGNEPRSFFHF